MSPYNRSWHDTRDSARSANLRPLTTAEIDQVSGGIIPILVAAIAGVLAATVAEEVADRFSDDAEEKSDD